MAKPSMPSPPALETAAARAGVAAAIGAWMIGMSMCRRSQRGVCNVGIGLYSVFFRDAFALENRRRLSGLSRPASPADGWNTPTVGRRGPEVKPREGECRGYVMWRLVRFI